MSDQETASTPPLICPVCMEIIEDGDGTEEAGEFVHYICLGEDDG